MTLTSHSGFKQLCSASHWPVGTGDDKVWGPGGLRVAVSLEALSLLAMDVKGGVLLTRLWELPGGASGRLGAVDGVTNHSRVTAS